jgi:hypothetical protein
MIINDLLIIITLQLPYEFQRQIDADGKTILKQTLIVADVMQQIRLTQDSCKDSHEKSGSHKTGEFHEQLRDYKLLLKTLLHGVLFTFYSDRNSKPLLILTFILN